MFILRNIPYCGHRVIPINILVSELANLFGFYLNDVVEQL